MRLKGINPFEQHVEKAVVGVVGVVALGILAWQFVGPPNTVKVKNNPVPIDQAYVQLQKDASDVQLKIRRETFDGLALDKIEMLKQYQARSTGTVAPTTTLAWAGESRGPVFEGGDLPLGGPSRYVVQALDAPAPATPLAATYLATISPAEVEAAPELAPLLPAAMPFDKAAVTIETTYDGTALATELRRDPDGDGPLVALPPHWWDRTVQILAVEVEREELQADGSWSQLTTIGPMPGRYSLHEDIKAGIKSQTALAELSIEATRASEAVRRPSYYAIVFGDEWVPPSERRVDFRPPNQAEIASATRLYEDAVQKIAELEEQLGQIDGDDPSSRNRRQGLQRSIDQQTIRRDRARDELRKLGAPVVGDDAPVELAPAEQAEAPLLEDSAIRLWTHDLTAERGKTYRYRVALVLPNPIYGQAAAIEPKLANLAADPIIRTRPSAWSEPVQVDPQTYYWITSAQDQPAGAAIGGGPRAAAEIYVFSWGYWRKGSALLEPGDPIAGRVRVPDFATMRPELVNPAPIQNPDDPNALPPVAPDPNTPVEPIYTELTVARDAYLLDVAAIPAVRDRGGVAGQAGSQFQAFLRDSDGSIVVRNPETERQSPAYQRVAQSATLGEQALRPKPVIRKPPPTPGKRDNEDPVGKPGGGGGSGGG